MKKEFFFEKKLNNSFQKLHVLATKSKAEETIFYITNHKQLTMKRLFLLFSLLFCLFVTAAVAQQVIYVDKDALGANDGSSWENAYTDLSVAIDAAESGSELWVAAGVYYPTSQPNYPVGSPDPQFNHFTLKNGVTLYGGFAGDETSLNQRDLTAYKTVLSGDIDQNDNVGENGYVTSYADVVGDNSYKLFYFPNGSTIDTTAVLDGFVLAGAVADNDVFPYMGGAAFLCQDASPKVVNCDFYGNYAKVDGGAIWIERSSMIIESCTFSGNYSENHAGAVYFNNTSAALKNCTFTNNTAKYGGAVYIEKGDETSIIEDCIFDGNTTLTSGNGGGISISSAKVFMKNTSFTNNYADSWGGGVVFHGSCDVDMVNCVVNGNTAGQWGGGIGCHSGSNDLTVTVRITNTKIQGNECGLYYGGGLALSKNTDCTLNNSIVSGNKIPIKSTNLGGGAVTVENASTLNAYNCTFIANNNKDGSLKMADFRVVTNSIINIYNSIIWDYEGEFYKDATGTVNVYNSRSVVYASVNGNNEDNPLFITNPWGISVPSTEGNFSLWGNSPVNNKGSNAYLPKDVYDLDNDGNTTEVIPLDLNGKQRVFAGVVDQGCFEQQFETESGNKISISDNQRVVMGTGVALNGSDFTIEMWLFPRKDAAVAQWHNICGNDDNGMNVRPPSLYIFQYDRIHYGYCDAESNWNSGDTEKALKVGQWNHIAMTFNDATNTITIFANGKMLETLVGVGEVLSTPLKYINYSNNLRAYIDEFRVWKEERTLEELVANMNRTLSGNEENLELYYSFDQVTSGDIEDQAGSYNGTLVNNPGIFNSDAIFTPVLESVTNVGIDNFTINWLPIPNAMEYYIDIATDEDFNNTVIFGQPTSGATTYTVNGLSRGTVYYYKVTARTNNDEWGRQYGHTATKLTPPGNAFEFDGSTYINSNDVCKYEFNGATIESWINTTNLYQSIWACNNSNGFNNYILFSQTDGHLLVAQKTEGGTPQDIHFGNAAVMSEGWNHVAVTIANDANHTVKIYVNGVYKGSGVGLADPFPYGSMLSLGQEFDKSGETFVPSDFYIGKMDEFRVWNRELTESEISENFNKT